MSHGNFMFHRWCVGVLRVVSACGLALSAAQVFGYTHTTRYNDNVQANATGTVTIVSYDAANHRYTLRLELTSVTGGGEPGWYGLGQIGIDGHTLSAYSGNPLPSPVVWTTADNQVLQGSVSAACMNGGMSWASSGTDFTLNLPVGGTERKKVTISIKNDKEYDVTYKLIQDGQEVGSYTLHPGEALIQQTEVDSDADVQVVAQINDLAYSDGQWQVVDGAVHSETVGTVTPSYSPPSSGTPIPSPDTPTSIGTPPPATGSGSQTNQIVWKSGGAASVPEDLLTKAVYKEGVEQQAKRLDKINTTLEEIKKQGDTKEETVPSESTLSANAEMMAGAARSKVDSEFAKLAGDLPSTAGGVALPSSSSGWPVFEIDGFGTIDMDPQKAAPWLYPLLGAGREVILWVLVVGFLRFAVLRVNEYSMQVAGTPQLQTTIAAQDMLPAAGQALSWLKGGLTAAAIIVVVVAIYGVGIGLLNSRLGAVISTGSLKGFVESSFTLPGGLSSSPVIELIMQGFPLGAFFGLAVGEVLLLVLMGPAFVGASLVVRAIRL